jgi:hypothetical protein
MKTVYLGQIVPFSDVKMVYDKLQPEYLFTSFTSSMEDGWVQNYIEKLATTFPETKIFITGYQCSITGDLPHNIQIVSDIDGFKRIIKEIYMNY